MFRNGDWNEKGRRSQTDTFGYLCKDGRRCVSVRFERGRDVAEAILPACRVTKNEGFTDEEVRGLEQYLESKNDEIFAKAKEINPIRGIL